MSTMLDKMVDSTYKELDRIHQLNLSDIDKTKLAINYLAARIKTVNDSVTAEDEATMTIDKFTYVSRTLALLYSYQEEFKEDLIADAITNLN